MPMVNLNGEYCPTVPAPERWTGLQLVGRERDDGARADDGENGVIGCVERPVGTGRGNNRGKPLKSGCNVRRQFGWEGN